KHARNILILSECKGAHTFWAAVNRLPLSSNAVLCWKFCHVFHKLLRDGHPNVIKDSMRNKADLTDMSRMWGHLSEGYGKLCSIYLKLLITKMEFHIKNPRFPGNLQMSNRQLDEAGENDVNNFFQLTVEMFDYLECELNLFLGVFSSLDMSRSVSVTAAGQCRLAPLIQVILDCSHLYDYTVKLLFKLHSCESLASGTPDPAALTSLFYRSSNLQYFKRLIQIPQLPENPPNFLRASALSEHISPVVVIPAESSSPESEHVVETDDLVDMDFDDLFGTSAAIDPFNFNSQNGMRKDDKLFFVHRQSDRLRQALSGRISELEAELAEQSHLRLQAAGESEFLKAELDDLRRVREDTEKEQRSLTEIERKAQANEQRYTKLKEKYTELVQSHADLLRKVRRGKKTRFSVCMRPPVSLCSAPKPKYAKSDYMPSFTPPFYLPPAEDLACLLAVSDMLQSDTLKLLVQLVFLVSGPNPYSLLSAVVGVSELVRAVTQCGHLVGDTIVQGSATSHMVPVEQADGKPLCVCCVLIVLRLIVFGVFFGLFTDLKPSMFPGLLQKLRPRGLELQQGELGDLVEQEMAATSAAVESAAARIEEMLNKSRAVDTGIKMEVNERILGSCTELMQAIKMLILSSKDLQREIVESGRGAASMKEFYAKNSRWTEGLISASKAVGWGATVMVDAADMVVQGKGKFEELMVCSHEIAASTAQLVAASKVKADKDSANLHRLQQASRGVTQATATVVASTKSGKSQIEDRGDMTLTQIKRQEMDAQVLVLELETRLQKERERLGELRKKHYELAGVAEGWGEEEEGEDRRPLGYSEYRDNLR
uniref:Huntingtin-interacting protein 1-related protein n=1 Tax=Salarias fasciatus TaxID=181472 RepID=A0A672HV30_SALFA